MRHPSSAPQQSGNVERDARHQRGTLLGNLMLAAGFGLILIGLLMPLTWARFVGGLGPFAQGTADPMMRSHAILIFFPIALLGPLLGGLGILAAGWSAKALLAAEHHIEMAQQSIAAFAASERERTRRFERIYGEMHERAEELRDIFTRTYVMVPGPSGTLVKAPISIGPSRMVDTDNIERLIAPGLRLDETELLPETERRLLEGIGVRTVRELAGSDPHRIAKRTGLPEGQIYRCVRAARLFALRGIPSHHVTCLVNAGVTSVADLASREAASLQRAMASESGDGACPTLAKVVEWIEQAKALVAGSESRQRTARESDSPERRTMGEAAPASQEPASRLARSRRPGAPS